MTYLELHSDLNDLYTLAYLLLYFEGKSVKTMQRGFHHSTQKDLCFRAREVAK